MANPPVGTMMMYGGTAKGLRLNELLHLGWLLCDGQSYTVSEYPDLYKRIKNNYGGDAKNFNVPDLRGRFVRGTDHGRSKDPDTALRTALSPGGNTGDAVGSGQPYATKRPVTDMVTDTTSAHTHAAPHLPGSHRETPLSAWGGTVMSWTDDSKTTSTNGGHKHTVTDGGDAESRPTNVYLYWLIKYK
ncbi:MAG TPA: phage tail protein [Ktedonobacteraceae bacterium]